MKSSRHQLILLGFICQAFSWDDYILPLLSAGLWFLCLKLPRKAINLGQFVEFGLIILGIFMGRIFAEMSGRNIGAFVFGYGLTLVQAARLMRPLNHREKVFSIFVACFQVGVACTIVLDYRFVFLFLATLVLLPRALAELEMDSYAVTAPTDGTKTPTAATLESIKVSREKSTSRFSSLGFAGYASIILVTALFYVCFPRGFGSQLPAPRFGQQMESTMLDYIVDPTRSGGANDDKVLLQVEGEGLSYLRCYALVDFDGQKWTGENYDDSRPLYGRPTDAQGYQHRRVRVKNVSSLAKILPTDGFPVSIEGKFFRNPFREQHAIVKAQVMWNTANNFYEYWTLPGLYKEDLSKRKIKRMTQYPAQSERLQAWLEERLEGTTSPLEQARKLEDYFQRNFTYTLGAPKLSRVNPVDDFIFNQKQGHCERFAAHLALLLRMKNIPTRVMIGYLPNSKSWFTGRYNIRFRDAHAWTEAWFKEVGWVLLDPTPASSMDRSGNPVREFLDAVDFMWYSHVVAFDAPAQSRLLNGSLQLFQNVAAWLNNNRLLFSIPVLLLGAFFARKFLGLFSFGRRRNKRQRDVAFAEDCYGQMLRVLAKKGLHRGLHQTPLEFLTEIEKRTPPFLADVRMITRTFCATRYGEFNLTPKENAEMKESLARLKTVK